MDAHARRRQEDLVKLQELTAEFRGLLAIKRTIGNPASSVELEIGVPTAKNARFPEEKQLASSVRIDLPARYPFDPPTVTVTTAVWNPNIFPSGLICLGQKWIPTHNLALLVQRVMQILALDPAIINLQSPANGEARTWYSSRKRGNPALFPTLDFDSIRAAAKRKIVWKAIQ